MPAAHSSPGTRSRKSPCVRSPTRPASPRRCSTTTSPTRSSCSRLQSKSTRDELQRITEPSGQGTPIDQLSESLDRYLVWIERNAETWAKLLQSATALPEAREVVQGFRAATLQNIVGRLTDERNPPPALRTALQGWLGYIDAAILDWVEHRDLTREQLGDLLVAAFTAALLAAQQADPKVQLHAV